MDETSKPSIKITVDGRPVLTTLQAAERYGLDGASVRPAARRYNVEPVAHLDARTPLYSAAELDKVMLNRPAPGRPRSKGKPRSTRYAEAGS